MLERICVVFLACILGGPAFAGVNRLEVSGSGIRNGFPLSEAYVVCDPADGATVQTVSGLFAEDLCRVTGRKVEVRGEVDGGYPVVTGIVGKNRFIDRLVAEGRLDVSGMEGGREQFVIRQVERPFAGVAEALVIAATDRRGVAYGVFTLSEKMGVSPFYWWADVPVERKDKVFVRADYLSESPSVAFRGIFLNDEGWGLNPWAAKTFEKELGNIGPKTYGKVCELILRLKGNMLAPAMHPCSTPFYVHPDNKVVADRYGILVTTSHCEPLLFNNASKQEWDSKTDGVWDYSKNRAAILDKLEKRVAEASCYENVYTLAMRGLHDAGMQGDLTEEEKVKLLEQAITDQRGLLSKYVQKPLKDIPQIFVPYKEALDLYEQGLAVPDEVTLVWPDDNYGYLKRLSSPQEQLRGGGSGVYYHLPYLGGPHDYLWLCTTPPMLMYEELKKAYDTGANRYWLLNVGDIKPMELGIHVVDLRTYYPQGTADVAFRLVDGLGYDWMALQMGEAVQTSFDPSSPDAPRAEFQLPRMEADSVTVQVYTLPFFPLYVGKGANRFGISVDDGPAVVVENTPREYSLQWKDQVLRNGALAVAKFAIDPGKAGHKLTLTCGDPGVMVERIVVDWGGLRPTYVGPSASLSRPADEDNHKHIKR